MSTATDVSPTVQQRLQRARVQLLAAAQRFIGPERSVSGLTVRAIWRLGETGHRDAGFKYTPRLSQRGKDFHVMKRLAEAKSTTETLVANNCGGLKFCSRLHRHVIGAYLVAFITVTKHKSQAHTSHDFYFRLCTTDYLLQ